MADNNIDNSILATEISIEYQIIIVCSFCKSTTLLFIHDSRLHEIANLQFYHNITVLNGFL